MVWQNPESYELSGFYFESLCERKDLLGLYRNFNQGARYGCKVAKMAVCVVVGNVFVVGFDDVCG